MLRIVILSLLAVVASTAYGLNVDECNGVGKEQACNIYLSPSDPDKVTVSLQVDSKQRVLFTLDRTKGYSSQRVKFTNVIETMMVTLIGTGENFYQHHDTQILAGTELWEHDKRSIFDFSGDSGVCDSPEYTYGEDLTPYTPQFYQSYGDDED